MRNEQDREGEEARERAEDCLTSSCQEREKKMNRSTKKYTRLWEKYTLLAERKQKPHQRSISWLDLSILTHSLSHSQISIPHAQTIHWLHFFHPLLQSSPYSLHSHTPPQSCTQSPPSPTTTKWTPLSCFPLVSLSMRTRQPKNLIGLFREFPGKPLLPFMLRPKHEYPISKMLPACCIRLKQY